MLVRGIRGRAATFDPVGIEADVSQLFGHVPELLRDAKIQRLQRDPGLGGMVARFAHSVGTVIAPRCRWRPPHRRAAKGSRKLSNVS